MAEKIILIENVSQAKEYLKNKKKFREYLPIIFDFPSEELFLNSEIEFKTEEEYETDTIYRRVYDSTLKNTNEICEKIKIYYQGIDLFQLFYMDLYRFLNLSKRYLRVLEKINNQEKIKKVIILKNCLNSSINKEICSNIAQEVFKGRVKKINYREKDPDIRFTIKAGRFFQRVISKIKLNTIKKGDIIFFDDSKMRIYPLIRELLKNKKNRLFRCQDHLQKSFFVDKNYIPFYEFCPEKSKNQKILIDDINNFKKKVKNFGFLKKLDIEINLIHLIRKWIDYYLQFKFLEVSGIINHIMRLLEKEKIRCIIVFADAESFDKIIVQVGRLFKVPSIVLLHGLLGKGFSPGFFPLSADYIFAYGKGSKERLHSLNIPKQRIISIGSQQFDKYFDKIIIKKEKKIVFIASYGTKKQVKDTLRIIFNALKRFPEYKLIIKGRNGWEMNNLPKLIAKEENFNRMEFVEEINPIKLFFDTEMVIINSTTMVLDALLMNKPVISIGFKGVEFGELSDTKAIKKVYNQKELEIAIKECQNETKKDCFERKKYLKRELFKLDGKSSKRMAIFINDLIGKNKNEKNKNNSSVRY